MKKVMGILAIALFSVGVYSYNDQNGDGLQLEFQNIDKALATDGTVNPKDKRNNYTDGTVNPKDKRNNYTDGTVNPKDKRNT